MNKFDELVRTVRLDSCAQRTTTGTTGVGTDELICAYVSRLRKRRIRVNPRPYRAAEYCSLSRELAQKSRRTFPPSALNGFRTNRLGVFFFIFSPNKPQLSTPMRSRCRGRVNAAPVRIRLSARRDVRSFRIPGSVITAVPPRPVTERHGNSFFTEIHIFF